MRCILHSSATWRIRRLRRNTGKRGAPGPRVFVLKRSGTASPISITVGWATTLNQRKLTRLDSMSAIRRLATELKHLPGWRAQGRYVAFAVDDYGSVRLSSREARDHLEASIPGFGGQMDCYDAVETCEDLEALFEVLRGVRDSDDRAAIFTAYALPANPDFQHMREVHAYAYESLTQTFRRLSAEQPRAYEGTWELWQEGMREGLIRPQCHGREHFSVPLLERKLIERDLDLEANLQVESLAGISNSPEMPGVGFT